MVRLDDLRRECRRAAKQASRHFGDLLEDVDSDGEVSSREHRAALSFNLAMESSKLAIPAGGADNNWAARRNRCANVRGNGLGYSEFDGDIGTIQSVTGNAEPT